MVPRFLLLLLSNPHQRDHPFDTEIRDAFNDHLCNGEEFTLVDHMAEGLSEPPTFAQVEFEAPEYVA